MTDQLTSCERELLVCLQQTFAPEDSDVQRAAEAVALALERLAPHRLAKLRMVLRMLAGPWLSLLLVGRFAAFDQLDHSTRERLLLAMADSPIPTMRTGFQALKRLALLLSYTVIDDSGRNSLWTSIGYPGPRTDRPPPAAALVLIVPAAEMEADAVVVGSGAGGAVAAALLARAGKRVIVLEAGPPADPATFDQLEANSLRRFYLESAACASDDLGISILAGSCVGGGTVLNWCTTLRLDERVAQEWREASGIDFGASLAEHYDAVERRIEVQPSTRHNENNAVLLRGCRSIGLHVDPTPCNRTGCGDGCGYCGFGCAYGSKRSSLATYLCDAVAAGASIVARARVSRVLTSNGMACGIEADVFSEEGNSARPLLVRAPIVVLAAGSLRTPAILARSGVVSPHLGQHLRLHPTTAAFGEFDHPVETWLGPMQSMHSDAFAELDGLYGAKLEAVPAHPGLIAFAAPWRGRDQHAALMRKARFGAISIALTRDRGCGSVSLDGRDDVRYRLAQYDARHMLRALAGLTDVMFAAGALRVTTLHTRPVELERAHANAAGRRAFGEEIATRGASANRLAVFSAHQMGTCRMNVDPRHGVVDERGAVYGLRGAYVADASVFPLASGVNPMLTIIALARRTASRILTSS
jgi:choline dehydrogenase-like flavoprotein